LSDERAQRDWRETNRRFPRWAQMIPSRWDWQKNDSALIETPLQLKTACWNAKVSCFWHKTDVWPCCKHWQKNGTGLLALVPIRFYELTKQAEQDLMTLVGLR
jgi:hypothetical protein